jgi:hypothetical protein
MPHQGLCQRLKVSRNKSKSKNAALACNGGRLAMAEHSGGPVEVKLALVLFRIKISLLHTFMYACIHANAFYFLAISATSNWPLFNLAHLPPLRHCRLIICPIKGEDDFWDDVAKVKILCLLKKMNWGALADFTLSLLGFVLDTTARTHLQWLYPGPACDFFWVKSMVPFRLN